MATNKGVWIKTWAVALFVSFLVTACGGGDGADGQAQTAAVAGPSASNSTGHNAADAVAAAGQRHQAFAVRTPDATALFDWAERTFPQFFPSHRANGLFDPYIFRYYPENGNYIAVAGSTVVVLGPVTDGKIVNVGVLSDFACQVYPGDCSPAPGPNGANNGCYDLALFDTAGTHLVVTYQNARVADGTRTIDSVVGNVTGFEGYAQAREGSFILTITPSAPGTGFESRGKVYTQRTGDAEVTGYGSTGSRRTLIGTTAVTSISKTVYTPPFVDRRYALALGETYTATQTGTSTITTTSGIPGQPDSSSTTSFTMTSTSTVKFVGRETVTVPAGTYATCRFDSTTSGPAGSTSATSLWFIDGKGILVKTVAEDGVGGTVSDFATLIELNGQKI